MIDRRLRVLQAIGRHRTLTAAAEACRLTPSAVSHQMQALARELDVTLLEPVGRGVRLTPAAQTLLTHVGVLAAQWEQAQAELATHRAGGITGPLRFCAFSTAAAVVIPLALSRLQDQHPGLRVQLREAEPASAFEMLSAGDADIAVVVVTPDVPPLSDSGFDTEQLYVEPLDVLLGPHHPLADRETIALADLAADPWIVGTPGRAYHQLVTVACIGAGFAPRVVHHADEWDTGAALVARGFGVALVPRLANLPAHHDTRRIPITGDPAPTRHVIAAVRAGSGHQPGITAGLDALRHVARDAVSGCPAAAPAGRRGGS